MAIVLARILGIIFVSHERDSRLTSAESWAESLDTRTATVDHIEYWCRVW
jgi:hypothetical protein